LLIVELGALTYNGILICKKLAVDFSRKVAVGKFQKALKLFLPPQHSATNLPAIGSWKLEVGSWKFKARSSNTIVIRKYD